ncbi:MAG: hypothetical protein ACRC6E_09210, partial [Fusobacteriaceae bacterium]
MSKLIGNNSVFLRDIDGVEHGKTSQVNGMNSILNNLLDNDNYLNNKIVTTQIKAGSGLIGGGGLTPTTELHVVSQDEGIIVNPDNIKLNIVDDLSTGGVRRPLSAEQGKVLNTKINA